MSEAPQGSRVGRGPAVAVSAEARNRAVQELMVAPWVDVATMATALDVGLNAAYKEAKAGRFGAFRVGSLYRVPTSELRKALGLPAAPALMPPLVEQVAA